MVPREVDWLTTSHSVSHDVFVAESIQQDPVKYMPAWIPGVEFMRTAMRGRELVRIAHYAPFEMVRQAVVRRELLRDCVILMPLV